MSEAEILEYENYAAFEEDDLPETGGDLRFETKKYVLQHLMEKAASVVPSRDLIPVLKNFLVTVQDGTLRVTATDTELSVIAHTQQVTVHQEGSVVFPARRFLDILRDAAEGTVVITVENGNATISIGPTTWTIKLQSAEDYPSLLDPETVSFCTVKRSRFVDAIRGVRYAASTETHRANLMLIDVSGGRMRASDGVRLQQIALDSEELPVDLQIPINAVDDLLAILTLSEAEEFEFGQTDTSLVFRVAGDVFIAQKLNAEFPDVDNLLLKSALSNDQELHVGRSDLESAIKRVRVTADPSTNGIILHLLKNKLVVSAKDKNGNFSEEAIDVVWESPDRTVAFNHTHLLQLLQMASSETAVIRFGLDTKTKPSPLLFVDDTAGQTGLLNQLRLSWLT